MITPIDRSTERRRIHKRIRQKISGNVNRPRLCIYRSSKYIYAQIVDDTQGKTLVAASTADNQNFSPDSRAASATALTRP